MKRAAALLCLLLFLFAPCARAEIIVMPESSEAGAAQDAAPAPTPFAQLYVGATGEAVSLVRQRLFALGYLADGTGDVYDEVVGAAVLAFQQRTGLAQTGRVNATTWNTLMDENAASIGGVAPASTPTPAAAPTLDTSGWIIPATATPAPTGSAYAGATFTRTLTYGAEGDDVRAVQTRLAELGYFRENVTGGYYDKTEEAVRSFQLRNGLSRDGVVGPDTWGKMMGECVRSDGTVASPADLQPAATPTPSPTPAPAQPGVSATPMPFTYERKLEYGDTGDDVAALQQRLTELGYFDAKVTGGYYRHTRDAVRAFQKNNGLTVDGVAGQDTQAALFADPQPVPSWATPRPTATPAPMPYLLEVDLTNQITTAYGLDEAGQYTLVVRQMICSTGTSSYPTPVETVEMPAKRARWGYFPQWDSHAQYLTRIDSLNAFHSVLYYSPNEDDLAVSSYEALGTPASHGCVRLLVADAKWIYDNCQAGTIIRIFEGEPDPELTESLKPPPLDYGTMLPAVTPQPTAEPVYDGVNFPAYSGILKRGTESEAVYFLQRRLQELGYYHGTVTGGYYGGTIEAVEAFQRDHGLSVDGVAGQQTLALLYSPDLSPSAVPTVSPTPTPSPALTLTPSPAPTAARTPEPDSFFVTATPGPTALPTATPAPTAIPTATPVPTATAIPTATPSPTLIPPDAPFSGNAVG